MGGAAVIEVKIKGAAHEFATLSGVKEDVLGILLNLKQVRFRLFGDGPFTASLKIKGIKTVVADDFKTPSQVEIMSKDVLIAHVTDKSTELEIEIQIGRGIRYEAAETRHIGKKEIGTISLDAIYTPIRRVSYRVEQMRVGDRTDFDRLIFEECHFSRFQSSFNATTWRLGLPFLPALILLIASFSAISCAFSRA